MADPAPPELLEPADPAKRERLLIVAEAEVTVHVR